MSGIRDRLSALPAAIAARPHLARLGAQVSDTMLVEVDGEETYLHFDRGALVRIEPGPSRKTPWRFALRTDAAALEAFWTPLPAPGFHDVFGLVKLGRARIEGDILALVRNLRFFKEVLALPRAAAPADAPAPAAVPAAVAEKAWIEPAVGRYLRLAVQGRAQRIFFEEAGAGPPVLCLHTAGADSRQWRHVLADEELTGRHRFIAFDMPWHGRSLPPDGFETEEYLLTTDAYIATVLAVCDGLGLERPILAGCSMGGRIALQLAARHPDRFAGFIAIEASDFQPAWYDIDWFHRPDAHGGEMGAALVSANIAPQAPPVFRWQTQWMFMQSGPGVFRGDLSFYTRDDSLKDMLHRIDTRRTPVHILCGEYDLTCTPEDARRTADAIPGAQMTVMEELGHFPMSEHPEAFRPYFAAALSGMASAAG